MDSSHSRVPRRQFRPDTLAARLGVDLDVLVAIAAGELGAELVTTTGANQTIRGSLADHRADVRAERAAEPAVLRCARLTSQARCVDGEFFVYRLLDLDDRVIYVGSSRRLPQRIDRHLATWPDAVFGLVVERFETAAAMLDAERDAIAVERPPLNIAGVA